MVRRRFVAGGPVAGLVALGIAALLTAVVLALIPIGVNGVSGNAIVPRYTDFGWFSYAPLPEHPTAADLRKAGVRVPQDAVAQRRLAVGLVAGAGIACLAVGVVIGRRRRA